MEASHYESESVDSVALQPAAENMPVPEPTTSSLSSGSHEVAKILGWKINVFILLPMVVLYVACLLDRSILANARTSIKSPFTLTSSQYGVASSVFNVGYIACQVSARKGNIGVHTVCTCLTVAPFLFSLLRLDLLQIPMTLLIKRTRPIKGIGLMVVAFGIVAAATAASRSFTELLICRVFLGIATSVSF